MATKKKQFDAYAALRGFGSGNKGGDAYSALASYKSPQPSEDEQKKKREEELKKQAEEEAKKGQQKNPKDKNLADYAGDFFSGVASTLDPRNLFSNTAKLADTGIAGLGGLVDAFTKPEAEAKKTLDERLRGKGVFGQGTFFPQGGQDKSLQGDIGEFAKKTGGAGAAVAAELAPVPAGIFAKGASTASKIAKGAAVGAATAGVGSAGGQLALEGRIDPAKTLTDLAMGTVLGGTVPGLGGAVNGLKSKIKGVHAAEDVIRTESMASAARKESIKTAPARANKALLDRNAPVQQLTKSIEEITGEKIAKDKDPYELMKLRGGTEGQIVNHLESTASWMKTIPKEIRQDGDVYGYAKQQLSRPDVYSEDVLKTAQNTVAKMETKYGDNLSVLDDYTQQTRKTFDSLVDLSEQNGLISKERADQFRANPDYFGKMEVLQNELDSTFPGQGNSINVRKAPFEKLKGQSKGATLAPAAESYVNQTKKVFDAIANNRVGKAVGGLADEVGAKDGLAFRPKEGNRTFAEGELPKGYTKISYLENGERREVAVPKEVGDILTGADAQQFDAITGMMGKVNDAFRQAVTTYNPLFTFWRNPQRDFKTFLTNSRYVPVRKALFAYSHGLFDSLFGGKWTKEFIDSGGGQAGYLAREGGQAGKAIARTAKDLTKKTNVAIKVLRSPLDLYKHVSQAIENAPRVAEYRGARKAGKSKLESAINAREVTVDFSQGGNLSKLANQWVPFLNARAQGTRRLAQAFKENPKRALTVYAGTSVLPIVGLMAWNNQNREVWDNIPDYEKENNFIVVLSNRKDASGRYTDVLKFPKGDVDKILGNTVETLADQASKKGANLGEALGKTLTASASNLSPISFANNGEASASALLSSALPPALKVPLQATTNYDLFKEQNIVPDSLKGAPTDEQFTGQTSELAKNLGKALGISPLQVDTALQGMFGSVPTDIASGGGNLLQRSARGITGASGSKGEQAFFDTYGPAKQTKDYREKQFYKLLDEGKYGEAQRKADEYNRDIDERFKKYFRQYGASLPDEIFPGTSPYELIDSLKMDVVVSKKGKPYIKR